MTKYHARPGDVQVSPLRLALNVLEGVLIVVCFFGFILLVSLADVG